MSWYCSLFLRVGLRWVWWQEARDSTEKERFFLHGYRAFEEQWTSRLKLCSERISSSSRLQAYSDDFLWGGILILCLYVFIFSCLLRPTLLKIVYLWSFFFGPIAANVIWESWLAFSFLCLCLICGLIATPRKVVMRNNYQVTEAF